MMRYPGRLAVQQRVLPSYRAPFFDLLASACDRGMSLFAGLPRRVEGIKTTQQLQIARYQQGQNIHLFSGALYLCYQRGLIEWLEGWNPDVLIMEANPRYLSTPAAIRWMHERNRPVLGWGLGAPSLVHASLPGKGFGSRVRSSFLQQFDGMLAYSQRGADEYASLGFPPERIYVAHNAVSGPPLFALPSRPLRFGERATLLFVGRLQARKRVADLLLACSQIEPRPRLVIVGEGPDRQDLERFAGEVYPQAEFVGAKHAQELEPYFREADLFVLPGTGGLAVQEAMSYGLPVIVAEGDGTQDDLVRRENGWQLPPGEVHYLIHILKDALSDAARLRRMGEESYRIVKEEINIEKMVETFVRALNGLARK